MVFLGPHAPAGQLLVSQPSSYKVVPSGIAVHCLGRGGHLLYTPLHALPVDRHGVDLHRTELEGLDSRFWQIPGQDGLGDVLIVLCLVRMCV